MVCTRIRLLVCLPAGFLCLILLVSPTGVYAVSQKNIAETNADTCDKDTDCQNGGICSEPNDVHAYRYCRCTEGYVGLHCSSYCPLDCRNGGYCRYQETSEPTRQYQQHRDPSDYFCQCFGLFDGPTCEIPYVNCGDGRRCYNGGICIFQKGNNSDIGSTSSLCSCPSGWMGDICQVQDDSSKGGQSKSNDRTGHILGILFGTIALTSCCWYTFVWLCRGKASNLPYESVEAQDSGERTSNDAPSWRNII